MPDPPDDRRDELNRLVELLPDKPGVYVFLDAQGEPLYVGKAQVLRQRVRSYFQASRDLGPRKETMVGQIAGLDHIVTDSAVEALILESNLIKRHHPPFNVRLRDDKQYPYLRVGLGEEFPGVTLVRSREDDGARYFGPYTRTRLLRETLRALRRVFPYHSCRNVVPRRRPCLNHFIGRCLAPCIGRASPAEYGQMVDGLVLFFSGRAEEVVRRLERQMERASEALDFERAALYRDQLKALGSIVERQRVITHSSVDRDVVTVALDPVEACAQVFYFRRGKLVGRESYWLKGAEGSSRGEVLGAFLSQFYAAAAEVPREVLLGCDIEDREIVEDWLSGLRGGKVSLRVPKRGEPAELVALTEKNAQLALDERRRMRGSDEQAVLADLSELAEALGLEEYPLRIECYDVSNLGGRDAVASMVVFEDGAPKKEDYRHFRVRTPGPDDYAMLREVLQRRLRRGRQALEAVVGHQEGAGGDQSVSRTVADSFSILPDLLVVDGGRGQADVAASVLAEEGLEGAFPVFGLAKQQEILYPPGGAPPVILPQGSGALFTLIRLRDEAHRFALSYHRKVRSRRSLKSILDDIPGVGPARRTVLLRHFGSGKAISKATLDELSAVTGIPSPVARAVFERFHKPEQVEVTPEEGQSKDEDKGENKGSRT